MQEDESPNDESPAEDIEDITEAVTDACIALLQYHKTEKTNSGDTEISHVSALNTLNDLDRLARTEKGAATLLCLSILELIEQILIECETQAPGLPTLPGILRLYARVMRVSKDRATIKKVMQVILIDRIHCALTSGDEDLTAAGITLLVAYASQCDLFRLLNSDSLELLRMVMELVFTDSRHAELLLASVHLLYRMTQWIQRRTSADSSSTWGARREQIVTLTTTAFTALNNDTTATLHL